MRVRYINSTTKADIRPPVDVTEATISDVYNNLMVEIIDQGAEVISTESEVVDGYFSIVRKFTNGVEVHLIPNMTKVQ